MDHAAMVRVLDRVGQRGTEVGGKTWAAPTFSFFSGPICLGGRVQGNGDPVHGF
jgi:hypothetical protein